MFNWFKKKMDSQKMNESKENNENQESFQNIENGPDYSEIDSNQKAVDLFNKGELTKIYLMPIEFGGIESPMNSLYVPEFTKMFKQRFDKMIEKLLVDGKKLSYSAEPEYKGKSFIPSKLKISVTGDSEFNETINIW